MTDKNETTGYLRQKLSTITEDLQGAIQTIDRYSEEQQIAERNRNELEESKKKNQILQRRLVETERLSKRQLSEIKRLEKNIEILRREMETVNQLKNDTETKKESTQFSKTTTESQSYRPKLTDNSQMHTSVDVAELSDENRPTKLAEKFSEIYDNEWTDAFEQINEYHDSENVTIEFLLQILQDVMQFCKSKADRQMDDLQMVLSCSSSQVHRSIPRNITTQLKNCRKAMANVSKENIFQQFLKSKGGKLKYIDQVKTFVEVCIDICWFMMIQDPPVVFGPDIQRGDEFNTDLYRAYTKSGKKVAYVVWPALLLHKEGPVLCKGVAQGLEDTTRRSKSAPPNERVDMGNEFRNEERHIKGHVNDLHVLDLEQSDGYLSKDKKYKEDRKYGIGTQGYDSGLNGYETYSKDIYKSSTGTYEARHGGTEQGCLGGYKSIDLRNDIGHTYEKPTRGYETKPLEHGLYTRDYHYEMEHIHPGTRGYDSGTPSYESNYRAGAAYRRQGYLRYESDYSDHGHRIGAYHQTGVSQPSRPSQKIAPCRDLRPAWQV